MQTMPILLSIYDVASATEPFSGFSWNLV